MNSPPFNDDESWGQFFNDDFSTYFPTSQTTPSPHPAQSCKDVSLPDREGHLPSDAFIGNTAELNVWQTPTPANTNTSSSNLENTRTNLEPISPLCNGIPPSEPTQCHNHPHCLQIPTSSPCPVVVPYASPHVPEIDTSTANDISLPNQVFTGEASTSHTPRKKRKLQRDSQDRSLQGLSTRSEDVPALLSPKSLLVSACLLYLNCNDWKKPSTIDMKFLSLLFPQTKPNTLHGIFDQLSNIDGSTPIDHAPTSSQPKLSSNQTTPHLAAQTVCEFWSSWRWRNPGEQPDEAQLNSLAHLYREDYDILEAYFKRTYKSADGEDSAYGTLSNTSAVEIAARKHRGNHNSCIKKGDKEIKKLEERRRAGRVPKRPYFCAECYQTFAKDRPSDFERHEAARVVHKVWLCCFDKCRPESSHLWKREGDFWEHHVKKKHPRVSRKDVVNCYAVIPGNFRRSCMLKNCCVEMENFEMSIEHMKTHMESDLMEFSQLRREADNKAVSERNRTDENSDAESSTYDGSTDSDNGDDDGPPAAGQSSGSGQQLGRFYKSGSSQPPESTSDRSGSANRVYGSSQSSRKALHLARVRSLESIRVSIPSLWSWSDFLRVAFPESPKMETVGHLGDGSNAVIDEIKIHGVSSTMARKTFRNFLSDLESRISREVESMSKLQHPHVVQLVVPYRETSSVAILMRPVADYNLSQYLATCSGTPIESRKSSIFLWFSCLSSGLEHIHEHGVCHFDIKPSNILVKGENVLFTDFGASTTIAGIKSTRALPPEFTRLYASPEMLKGELRAESDIFSLGCVFLEMVTTLLSTDLWQKLRLHQQQAQDSHQSHVHWATSWKKVLHNYAEHESVQSLLDVFDSMIQLIPDQRPSATEIKNRINARTDIACTHYRHKSVQDYTFRIPVRASTWPPDRATLTRNAAESQRRLRITSTDDFQIYNDAQLSRSAFVTQRDGPDSSMTMAFNINTSLAIATIRSGARESRGIDSKSMMMPFLHQWDPHERFRVSGQATKAMKMAWANLYRRSRSMSIYYEQGDLALELSTLSVSDYGQVRAITDDESSNADMDG